MVARPGLSRMARPGLSRTYDKGTASSEQYKGRLHALAGGRKNWGVGMSNTWGGGGACTRTCKAGAWGTGRQEGMHSGVKRC